MKSPIKKRQAKLEHQRQKLLSAEEAILNNLFNDMYYKRHRVYRVNFIRGLCFGFGSLLGGTIVVAAIIALLQLFTNIPAGVGDFFRNIIEALQRR